VAVLALGVLTTGRWATATARRTAELSAVPADRVV
jgi:hypothetical protein